VLILPLLAACGGSSANTGEIAWVQDEEIAPTEPVVPTAPAEDDSSGLGAAVEFPIVLGADDLARVKPDELGRIPILMYHAFTTNPDNLDDWTVTPEIFLDDLTWLYEHDFYIVSMHDMIHNEMKVPPGKHPVVLTFDDSSSGQFRLLKDAKGTFSPDPVTAVGVMEDFFAQHPDFGRGGFFAVLPYNCFKHDPEQSTCEQRLTWLADHGYEIGNHTWGHQNLSDVSDATLMEQVALTKLWIDERVGGDANMSGMLVLPYGEFPSYDWQIEMLHNGFVYDGQTITLSGIVSVEGGPSVSPSSGNWTRWNIARFNTDRQTWGYWQKQIERGEITVFTSDGNPESVTIPNQIPGDVADQLDPEWAQAYEMRLVRYDLPEGEPDSSSTPGSATPPAKLDMPDAPSPAGRRKRPRQ
jgi:peptidoglycan/xylan/chitin deacetylase (PgdA/CDA1 family)